MLNSAQFWTPSQFEH